MKASLLLYAILPVIYQLQICDLQAQSRYGKPLDEGILTCMSSTKGILYNGIDNLLQINSSALKDYDTIVFKTSNGIIVNDTLNTYLCLPEKPGTLSLSLLSIKAKDTITIGFKTFKVMNLPEPKLMLNDQPIQTPLSIPKSLLINCDSLGIYFSEDIKGSEKWFKITEFTLGYSYGGYYVSHINPSDKLTQSTKEIINKLGPEKEISIRPVIRSMGRIQKELPIYRLKIY